MGHCSYGSFPDMVWVQFYIRFLTCRQYQIHCECSMGNTGIVLTLLPNYVDVCVSHCSGGNGVSRMFWCIQESSAAAWLWTHSMSGLCWTAGYRGQLSTLSRMPTCVPVASRCSQPAKERRSAADYWGAWTSVPDWRGWWTHVWHTSRRCSVAVLQDLWKDNLPQVLFFKYTSQRWHSAYGTPGWHFGGCVYQRKGNQHCLIAVFVILLCDICANSIVNYMCRFIVEQWFSIVGTVFRFRFVINIKLCM